VNHAVEMGLIAVIYTRSLIKIGSAFQMLKRGDTQTVEIA
jgi:hypothetical protein